MARWPERTTLERFEDKFIKSIGCWEWRASKGNKGYGQFLINGQIRQAHRVSYQLYVGEIPEGLYVCHRCDNPGCVNPSHLFLGTQTDNMRDCENKGRGVHPSGEQHYFAKLTEKQVAEIRARRNDGTTQTDLANEYGVSQPTISHIFCGDTWAST